MPTKLGHFEIVSELSKSPTGIVYKANDPESGQPVALKAIQLSAFGEHAQALEQALSAEGEATKVLTSQNICMCTAPERLTGSSARRWSMYRATASPPCSRAKKDFPFGICWISDASFVADSITLHRRTSSPQPRTIQDHVRMGRHRKNIELWHFERRRFCATSDRRTVVDSALHVPRANSRRGPRRAFESVQPGRDVLRNGDRAQGIRIATDVESTCQSILESTPVAPVHVSPKIHPVLSDLIMKALAKDPAESVPERKGSARRSGKLQRSKPAAAKKAPAPSGLAAPPQVKAAAQSKFVGQSTAKPGSRDAATSCAAGEASSPTGGEIGAR